MKFFPSRARHTVVAITVFLLLQTSDRQSSAQPNPETKKEILELLAVHRFPEAEAVATAYVAAAPDDCNGKVLLGLSFRGEGNVQSAFKSFRAAMDQCPQSLAALEGAAEAAYISNLPEAKDLVTRVIQLHPEEETGYAMLGAIDARAGDCAAAVESYQKASGLVNQNPAALKEYGRCLIAVDRVTDAVPVLSHLLALQDNSSNRIALARTQEAAKDRSAALATLQPLLGTNSQNAPAFLLAAELAEADSQTPQAVEWFRKAIELNPRDATAYLAFAEMSFNHGAFKVGVDFLTIGIQQLPSDARLYLARGVLKEQMAQMDDALSDFEQAHRIDPQLSFAQDAIGMLFSQKHDTPAALALFAKQTELHPEDGLLQFLYAEALSQVDSADEDATRKAITAAQRAVTLEPGYQPARDLLCVLLLRHNDLAETINQAGEATKRDPYDEVALYQEFRAENKLQHTERAAALLKQLQAAKTHNQEPKTKFLLQEAQAPQ